MIFKTIRLSAFVAAATCVALLGTNFAAPAFADENDVVVASDAPQLVTGEDTCMGSSAIGGQAAGFGISFGTTWTDANCQRLKNARQLASLGFKAGAIALVCLDEDVQTAMRAAGTPCPYERDNDDDRAEAPRRAQAVAEVEAVETKVADNKIRTDAAPAKPSAARLNFVPMQPVKD